MSKKSRDILDKKDIYRLFNDLQFDNKELENMDINLTDVQKKRIIKEVNKKANHKKPFRTTKRAVAAAVAGLALLIGLSTVNPSMAENVPLVAYIIQTVNERYGIDKNYDKFAQVVDQNISSKGVDLTIHDVLCDDSNLLMSYTIKSDKNLREIIESGQVIPMMDIMDNMKINGKRLYSGGGLADGLIDDNTYRAVSTTRLNPNEKLPEDFNINLKIGEIFGIKGKWDTAFTVSKEEISKNIKVVAVKQKVDFENSSIIIDKVSFTPINTYILIRGEYRNPKHEDKPFFDHDYWFVFDDTGTYLHRSYNGGAHAKDGEFNYTMSFEPLDNIPQYLTVIPCDLTPSVQGGGAIDGKPMPPAKINKVIETIKPLQNNYPLELAQGDFGKLLIEKIDYEKDRTKVSYIAEGAVPCYQANALQIRNDKGEKISSKGEAELISQENGTYKFIKEFEPLEKDRTYSFVTNTFNNYKLREDLKFNIEL